LTRFLSSLSRIFNRHSKNILEELLSRDKLDQLEKLIGYPINNDQYFVQALMHRSYLEQNTEFETSNERLEFLGDAVLSVTVAEYLFKKFPEEDEGFLTKVRSKFVNKIAIADIAEEINLAEFLLVGKNLMQGLNYSSKTILADAFEALIGAIFLDSGLEPAKSFISRVLIEPYAKAGVHLIDENFKSQLLEYAQAKKLEPPVYTVIKEEGPHHDKVFTIKVAIGDIEFGIGKGRSKKTAEQNAAEEAIHRIESSKQFK
jgi:ribonuclease III